MPAFAPGPAQRALLIALLFLALPGWGENRIAVGETFYQLTQDDDGRYQRREVDQVRPGTLVELVVTATNAGATTARNVELVNTLPGGRASLVADSFRVDDNLAEYRVSPSGETWFPPSVEMPAAEIRYVQWLILTLLPGQSTELSYRLRIE